MHEQLLHPSPAAKLAPDSCSSPRQTHDFASATVYIVRLTVTDDAGQQTSKSVLVAVQP